ncbi:TonB-dependent receptor [Sunxiuqinia rutila]|uniref:TonB-dependent receptor n=1 Tax=Sunxiuqinia rutila TaxID=1397841 RepID=UPI003D3615C2
MKRFLLYLLLVIEGGTTLAQDKFTISGYLTDSRNGEKLIGATIMTPENQKGTVTNQYGFFSLTLPPGNYHFSCRYIGYYPQSITIPLFGDTIITVELETNLTIDEVEVIGRKVNQTLNQLSTLSYGTIDLAQLKKAPVILGEQDLLKGLQYLPGVKQGRENTAAFHVRGGSNDQNLILLDGAPVYNVNHMFGFFSVFNNDALNHVAFYKAGIPARYGGRLASVLDISMKEGNLKQKGGIISISPISGRLTYETPIVKDKSSLIISGRRTWLDIPLRLLLKLQESDQNYGYFFYDLNAKLNWKINDKNRIYLSSYNGKDEQFFRSVEDDMRTRFNYNWGNLTSVLRWNTILSQKIFANVSFYYSQYKLDEQTITSTELSRSIFLSQSKMKDVSIKTDIDYYLLPDYKIKFGGSLSSQLFYPGFSHSKTTEGQITFNDQERNKLKNVRIYAENQVTLGAVSFNAGLAVSGSKTGTKTYIQIEPRLALSYQVTPDLSLYTSYGQFSQNLHLLSNSSLGLPTDLWVASTEHTKPQTGNQYALGLKKEITTVYSFAAEMYYKSMNNLIRFDEGAIFLSTKRMNWEDNILIGKGKSYGIEFDLRKNTGRLSGSFSYTLAWSKRQFDQLNRGRWFNYKYDRRHDLSVLCEYKLKSNRSTRSRSLNVGFTLQSGNKLSLPEVEHEALVPFHMDYAFRPEDRDEFSTVSSYANPNQFKMPMFHHLDVAYNIHVKKGKARGYEWNFSLYNIYNRMNPWFYYKSQGTVKQVSVFPFIPSVGFTYRW